MVTARRYFVALPLLALLGLYQTVQAGLWLVPPYVYSKDIIQEYLLARAVAAGVNPYQPLPDLAAYFMGPLPFPIFPHPSAHPPPVVLLFIPFALINYRAAAAIWFVLELIFTFVAVRLLLRCVQWHTTTLGTFVVMFAVLTWKPFYVELQAGQLMILLLLLLTISWSALRSGRDIFGGAALGCAIAVKLTGWPIIAFLAIRGRLRAVYSASLIIAAANLLTAPLIGWQTVLNFYVHVGPAVTALISDLYRNFSPYSIGFRLFSGTSVSGIPSEVTAPPLLHAPKLVLPVSVLAVVVFLLYGLWSSMRVRSFDAAFALLVCVSLAVNPVAWDHYLLLALIALTHAASRLIALGLPQKETITAGIIAALLYSYYHLELAVRTAYGAKNTLGAPTIRLPFYVSLITLAPLIGVIGLMWLVRHLDRVGSTD
jgi:Glycosyltransferase family 87